MIKTALKAGELRVEARWHLGTAAPGNDSSEPFNMEFGYDTRKAEDLVRALRASARFTHVRLFQGKVEIHEVELMVI